MLKSIKKKYIYIYTVYTYIFIIYSIGNALKNMQFNRFTINKKKSVRNAKIIPC